MTGDPRRPEAVRRRRAALAGHAGESAVARSMVVDPDPGVGATALAAVVRAADPDDPDDMDAAVRAVEAALSNPAPLMRMRAAELAGGLGAGGAGRLAAVLTARLVDDDPRVVEIAAWALGEQGPDSVDAAPEVLAALAEVVAGHADPLCREAAVAALGAIGDERSLPAVLAATTDRPAIRRRAVIALAAFTGPDVEAALARALTDRDWQVRQAAEDLTQR